MFVEFESTYRLLDLTEGADAERVRGVFVERLRALEQQKENAGSKPERMIAAKAVAGLKQHEADVERLASALEAHAWIAETHEAVREGKAARAGRAVKNARAAAEKSGLRALVEAVAEAEDALADSGLVRDAALERELEELLAKLAAVEAAVLASTDPALAPPADALATIGALEAKRVAVLARLGARRDEETRRLLEDVAARLAMSRTACEARAKSAALAQVRAQIRALRARLAGAVPTERIEKLDAHVLVRTLAELDSALAASVPEIARDDADFDSERAALRAQAEAIREALPRREASAALDVLEADLAAGPLSSGLAARVGEVEKLCLQAGLESAPARIAALREQIARKAKPPPLQKPVETAPPVPVAPPAEEKKGSGSPSKPPAPPPLPPVVSTTDAEDADDAAGVTMPFVPKLEAPTPAECSRFTLVGPKGERCHVLGVDPVVFGRASSSDFAIRAFHPSNPREADRVTRSVSRAHFTIAVVGESIEIRDGAAPPGGALQRSVNGTFDGDGGDIERLSVADEQPVKLRITRETDPAIPPSWTLHLQRRATLGVAVGALRDANPPGPDAALMRRTDGARESVLLLWRAANLRELGLVSGEAVIVRHKGGFLLWEAGRLLELETGFRVGGFWQVAKMGTLAYSE
ncbi:hypothetical protein ASA1KI_11130 [Opitutales bacterium ASA1]|uniref:hypothetical protein n=1 Tax=Congregicoccus parvus TaxID=3081749 RepID=UPI002B28BF5C|nr:hypothetical protein ASA1KI_11130 [Opitutales bacterium ASA1]